jgi:hypothetical protein
MEACYGGMDLMERSCAVARGKDINISHPHSSGPPGVFCIYFYNHARRLRLEKLLYLELSRSPNGFFKGLLDPGGGFNNETVSEVRRLQIYNGYRALCNGHSPTDKNVRSGVTVM